MGHTGNTRKRKRAIGECQMRGIVSNCHHRIAVAPLTQHIMRWLGMAFCLHLAAERMYIRM